MEPVVQLISAWQEYARHADQISVKDFCQDFLAKKKRNVTAGKGSDLNLAKQLGKANSLVKAYFKIALRQTSDMELEWYYFLDAIAAAGEIRKNDIVSFRLLGEPTTGIDIINRMLKAGLIAERVDPDDKRARLIKLTPKGKQRHHQLGILFDEIAAEVFRGMDTELKTKMVAALAKMTDEHSVAIKNNKGKALDSIEESVKKITRDLKR
jgi:DNA-binding MarR family transcriptional regulator